MSEYEESELNKMGWDAPLIGFPAEPEEETDGHRRGRAAVVSAREAVSMAVFYLEKLVPNPHITSTIKQLVRQCEVMGVWIGEQDPRHTTSIGGPFDRTQLWWHLEVLNVSRGKWAVYRTARRYVRGPLYFVGYATSERKGKQVLEDSYRAVPDLA